MGTDDRAKGDRKVPEIVSVDFGAAGLKLVRARQSKEGPMVLDAGILPPRAEAEGGAERTGRRLDLPRTWNSHYVNLLLSGKDAVIRHMTLPGGSGSLESRAREHMSLEGDYRLSCIRIPGPQKRTEIRLLAGALPEAQVAAALALVPAGRPAAWSLEISCLSALHAFAANGPLERHGEDTVGFIEAGAQVTLLALFHQRNLVLVRKFNLGGETLVERVSRQMSVSREVAEGILREASFDISQTVADIMDPFLRQISISRDFVERREGGSLKAMYVSGGMSLSHFWIERLGSVFGLQAAPWNPFDGIRAAEGSWRQEVAGQEPRLAAALGGALGALGEA